MLIERPVCACGSPATANGRECGDCFRARLRSVRLSDEVTATRTKVNHFDSQALDETFGEDRVDRYWEDTHGFGALHRVGDELMHRDHKGELQVASDHVVDVLTQGEEAGDAV